MSKSKLKTAIVCMKKSISKHNTEILIGIGIAGMITTTVMAVRATPKALVLIEDEKSRLNCDGSDSENVLKAQDVIKVTWKCYIPSTIVGLVSVGCLIAASSVSSRRIAALSTAYTLSESALKEYQEKVVETIGEKKEKAIRDEIAKDKIKQKPINNNEVVMTDKGNTLCLDYVSGRYFMSDIEKIKKSINDLNRRMRNEMYISLNEFYSEIGLTGNGIGDDIGWNIDKEGYIEPCFTSELTNDGRPCLVISYLVGPRYDYRSY